MADGIARNVPPLRVSDNVDTTEDEANKDVNIFYGMYCTKEFTWRVIIREDKPTKAH